MTPTLRKTTLFSTLALLLLAAGTVAAQDMRFLAETPYSFFKKEDKDMFWKTLNATLDNAKDGESNAWSNPKTNAGGEVKVLKSYEDKGRKCRTAHIANKAQGRSNAGEYDFCIKSGKWAIASMGKPAAK